MINPDLTDLVLLNALYFKGKWQNAFDPALTKDRLFYPANGAARDVPMMRLSHTFLCRQSFGDQGMGTGYRAVRLPYGGGKLAMVIFLPDHDSSPAKLLQSLNGDTWQRVTMPGFTEKRDGVLVLPEFKIGSTLDLIPPLQKLGLNTAFDLNHSDFSGMFKDAHCISVVRQKAFVEVAEEGTEAAAATTEALMTRGIDPDRFVMIVDHPFLFAIVDARSQMILFMGIVNAL
jgi:serpin B